MVKHLLWGAVLLLVVQLYFVCNQAIATPPGYEFGGSTCVSDAACGNDGGCIPAIYRIYLFQNPDGTPNENGAFFDMCVLYGADEEEYEGSDFEICAKAEDSETVCDNTRDGSFITCPEMAVYDCGEATYILVGGGPPPGFIETTSCASQTEDCECAGQVEGYDDLTGAAGCTNL